MASQITGFTNVYPAVCLGPDERKHQSSASPAFVRRIHRRPENSPHKGPVTRKAFPFDDVINFRDTSMALWQPDSSPNASEGTLNAMGKQTTLLHYKSLL